MSNTSQASQRITALLDENSFVEIGAKVTARATDFNLKQTKTPSDGVITGYGVIDGNLVYVYSQDASVLGPGTDSGTDRLYLYGKQKSKAVRKFPKRYGRQLDREGRYLFCKIPE